MKKTADVVIIGGGIVGLSIAYYLALKKAGRIILFEKGQLGEGSTGRSVGGIRTQFSTEINIRFSLESLKIFEQFEEEFGVNPEFKRVGYLFLATTKEEMEIVRSNISLQKKFNIPVELLDPEEIVARWPYLSMDDILGGTFCSWDGYAGPSEVLSGFARGAKRAGVKICEGMEVVEISVVKGKVHDVKTKDEEIFTPLIVNAGGPYAASIGEMVGIEIPVKPLRRQVFITAPFHLSDHPIPLTIDLHRGWYFRQEGDGLLLSGPLDREPSFNLNIDYEAMAETSENAIYRVPALNKACLARGWAGLYEISPDHHAILGKAPGIEGFILANGFSGHGFQHSPAVGRIIAELIVQGEATTIDISSLSMDRFKKGALILEPMTAFKE
ncbi:MAG TPA: FAD-binding oxidoreductase [Thermodesulfobacteriota bacterium]|nr:FAD-binding oxidoreductase [Thermodesulfobacteriota bacterium]